MNESGCSVGELSPVQKPFSLVHCCRLKLWAIAQLYSHLLVVRRHRVNTAWLPVYLLHSNIEKMTCLEIEWVLSATVYKTQIKWPQLGCVCTKTVIALPLMHFTSMAFALSLPKRWVRHKKRLVIISHLEMLSSRHWFLNLIFYFEDWFFFMENFQVVVEHSIQIMVQSNLLIGLSHSPRTADAPGQPSRMKANTGRLALTAISESPAVTASVWTALWRLVPCLLNWFCECKHFSYRRLSHFLRWKEYSFTAWIV